MIPTILEVEHASFLWRFYALGICVLGLPVSLHHAFTLLSPKTCSSYADRLQPSRDSLLSFRLAVQPCAGLCDVDFCI